NGFGLTAAPDLLMVKTSELNDFFLKNRLPDNKTSFAASYDSEKQNYTFASMRPYIVDLLGKASISADDVDFTLVPVNLVKVTDSDYYSNSTTYVTKCLPYTLKPTMTLLHTDKALIVFSFSSQKFD
ncbi:MAG: DUF4270 domain-containing protein, partial [Muribaculaceae bacterium]|nr:DUF4270 domain-containing protein [Muribaculaceae bacterium]